MNWSTHDDVQQGYDRICDGHTPVFSFLRIFDFLISAGCNQFHGQEVKITPGKDQKGDNKAAKFLL